MRKLRLKNGTLRTLERDIEIGCPIAKPQFQEVESDYWASCNEYCAWYHTSEEKVYDSRTIPKVITYACCGPHKIGELVEVDE